MRDIELTSDIDAALRDVRDTFERQIPFALTGAVVDTAFEVRRRVVESTWGDAFDVKNARFAGVTIKVMDDTGGQLRGGVGALTRQLRSNDEFEISVGDSLGREYLANHASGGTKHPRTSNIAVPVEPEKVRGASGRVLKNKKPINLTNKKQFFVLKRGGQKLAIMERRGKDTTAVYLFMSQAQIPKRFRFYEDAMDTVDVSFFKNLDDRLAGVIRSSRFYPG